MTISAQNELTHTIECLVIDVRLDEDRHELVLTTDSSGKLPGMDRQFLEFRFTGVSRFTRTYGAWKASYEPGALVIQDVEIKRGQPHRIAISFGSYGELSFTCSQMLCDKLDTRAVRAHGDWIYFDAGTGRKLDYFDPFGRRAASRDDHLLRCRVCGLLREPPPWGEDGQTPSYERCPCCGVKSGAQDATTNEARRYRQRWIESGATWERPRQRPADWDFAKQLELIPTAFR